MLHRNEPQRGPGYKLAGIAAALSLIAPLIQGCSSPQNTYAGSPGPQPGAGPSLSLRPDKKLALLTGSGALYYMYRKHQSATGAGITGRYFRSKSGGVYYRDRNGSPVWVPSPTGGLQVPALEAARYQREAKQHGFRETVPVGSPNPADVQ